MSMITLSPSKMILSDVNRRYGLVRDLALTNAGFQPLEPCLQRRFANGIAHLETLDLIPGLDHSRVHHHSLTVHEPRRLELFSEHFQSGGLPQIDAQRAPCQAKPSQGTGQGSRPGIGL